MSFFYEQLKKNDLVAAPMAGISVAPFRKLLRDFHNGLIYTEMVSVEGVKRDNPMSTEYLDTMDEGPTVTQLFGGNHESYHEAVSVAEKYCKIDAFDINMGCPVKKVVKAGGGCALLKDLNKIELIIKSLRHATEKPFSVKIRLGWDDSRYVYREILDIAQTCGANALIMHARTRNQMFSGDINLDALADLATSAKIPVIGNGNVVNYETYKQIKDTGVNGVMIGRGMMYAPWIFQAVKEEKTPDNYLTPSEIRNILLKFYLYMQEHASEKQRLMNNYNNIIKKFAVWFSKGLSGSAQFRADVYGTQNMDGFFKLLNYFEH